MSAEVIKKEENLQKIKKKVCEVSNNFNELEFFKGRFLKHIYLHQTAVGEEYQDESNNVAVEFRNAPPIFSALEQRRITLQRQKKLRVKSKPLDTHILGCRGARGASRFLCASEVMRSFINSGVELIKFEYKIRVKFKFYLLFHLYLRFSISSWINLTVLILSRLFRIFQTIYFFQF